MCAFFPKVIDIRWLNPLPEEDILSYAKQFKRILVVDECRKTGSPSEELFTQMNEEQKGLHINRLTAEDCFIPLGDASRLILPSVDKIVVIILKNLLKKIIYVKLDLGMAAD